MSWARDGAIGAFSGPSSAPETRKRGQMGGEMPGFHIPCSAKNGGGSGGRDAGWEGPVGPSSAPESVKLGAFQASKRKTYQLLATAARGGPSGTAELGRTRQAAAEEALVMERGAPGRSAGGPGDRGYLQFAGHNEVGPGGGPGAQQTNLGTPVTPFWRWRQRRRDLSLSQSHCQDAEKDSGGVSHGRGPRALALRPPSLSHSVHTRRPHQDICILP